MSPRSAVSDGSSKTWATRPISLWTTIRLPSLTAMPGRLLAAVLQRVQSVVGELGDVFPGRPDAKDTTGVPRRAVVGIEIVRKAPVWLSHDTSLFGQVSGRNAERSARAPLALTAPVCTASCPAEPPGRELEPGQPDPSPPRWAESLACGGGPATACTAATGTTLTSTERPGLTLSSSCNRNRAADRRAACSGSVPVKRGANHRDAGLSLGIRLTRGMPQPPLAVNAYGGGQRRYSQGANGRRPRPRARGSRGS